MTFLIKYPIRKETKKPPPDVAAKRIDILNIHNLSP